MTLQSSGNPISLQDIGDEANGTTNSTNTVSLDDASIRGLLSKTAGATNSFNEYYGVSSEVVLSSSALVNGQSNRLQMTASSFISSGGTLRIPSNMWVWSDNVSTAALTIDIPCTIINDGYIIGKGGKGGNGQGTSGNTAQNGEAGGNAIKINSGISNVTITNNSGAYIAGGGGGGRILPATTQADATSGNSGLFSVGKGGGGGVAGGNGNSGGGTGGAAGKAIEDSGNTYTLTNNGTIFGATT